MYVFNTSQVRKSQGHLMTGDSESKNEMILSAFLWNYSWYCHAFVACSISTIQLLNQSHNSEMSCADNEHLDLFHTPSGPGLGGIRDKLWKMRTEFCLFRSDPKDYTSRLLHKISLPTGMIHFDSWRYLRTHPCSFCKLPSSLLSSSSHTQRDPDIKYTGV